MQARLTQWASLPPINDGWSKTAFKQNHLLPIYHPVLDGDVHTISDP